MLALVIGVQDSVTVMLVFVEEHVNIKMVVLSQIKSLAPGMEGVYRSVN